MKIVIDMPKEMWEQVKAGYFPADVDECVEHGTPLPNIDVIDTWLRENVYTCEDFLYDVDHIDTADDHIDVIASLQNVLHMIVKGEPYDYAYHWTNKIGRNYVNDYIFIDMISKDDVLSIDDWKPVIDNFNDAKKFASALTDMLNNIRKEEGKDEL